VAQIPALYGVAGVYLFFVISGFCIHLKQARASAQGHPAHIDAGVFWKRRFWRLYPAYFAALMLSLALQAHSKEVALDGFYVWDVVSHLLLIHNFDVRTVYSINGVLWTLAIEVQLYAAYFLLIKMRTAWGWTKTLLFCAAARMMWFLLNLLFYSKQGWSLPMSESWVANWFMWALGAVSVEAAVGGLSLPSWCRSLKWGTAILLLAAGLHAVDVSMPRLLPSVLQWMFLRQVIFFAWAVGFFCLVNWAVSTVQARPTHSAFSWVGALKTVGVFSYSLYLTHLLVLHQFTSPIIGVPVSLLAAWAFFLIFERPFIISPGPKPSSAAPVAP